ncbi:MAG: DNA translocase FtsK [Candidatus Harrisonbacteria bacterium]|nr:DNA translocase FtsK [Candidatus Harrisonbacteria bacterium]
MRRKLRKAHVVEEVEAGGFLSRVSPETKKSVAAVVLLGIAAILLLASFGKAGPLGTFLFALLSKLFGWGYYLWPFIAFVVAFSFLLTHEEKFFALTAAGVGGFIAGGLGLIDIIFPEKGGLIGIGIGALEVPFGYTASLIVTGCIMLASLLVALDAKIVLVRPKTAEDGKAEAEAAQLAAAKKPLMEQHSVVVKSSDGKKETMTLGDARPNKTDGDEEKPKKEEVDEKDIAISYGSAAKPRGGEPYTPQNYTAPPLALLKSSTEKPTSGDLRANANIIKRTLDSFGIPVEMGEINIGPKVTRYTLKPAEGIKLARILALHQDLALALAAHPIRIEAPIPGKSLVGIEVPNKSAAIVRLGTLLGYQEFATSGPLSFVLGRDVTGEPIFANIEKMPHLLIAGATGSGKSVAIHALIISLLYKNSPETLKFIMIDPKRVELSVYDGIPHLVAPVITEGKKSVGVFRWAISEMERRYEMLLHAGVRDVKGYNKANRAPLPYLVIVVDELADLMAAYGREVETSIVRLAQMSRATGIHLVLSTQRPSVEVITGLIKANITARMALQVASQVDSRTILDMAGAEKLLGGGDMLFMSSDFSKPKRIQGAYVSEEEINKVSDFVMEHNLGAERIKETAKDTEAAIAAEGAAAVEAPALMSEVNFDEALPDDDDELYDEAVKVVVEAKKASASLLQRRLKVGYARAARLLDMMEAKGIVGPGDGAKPREVFLESSGPDIEPEHFENGE